MEFRYNRTKNEWEHQESKDSKFRITTLRGNTIEIPNFIETRKDFIKTLGDIRSYGEIIYECKGSVPTFRVDITSFSRCCYVCDITTGQWGQFDIWFTDLMVCLSEYDNEILQKRVQTLEQTLSETKSQVSQLMAFYNHVRETETNMDVFLTVARECVKAEEACTVKK